MKYFQEIENYIWGRLSTEEKEAFERQLEKDEVLAEKVAKEQQERELIIKMEENYWLEQMKDWREEMQTDEQFNTQPQSGTDQDHKPEHSRRGKPGPSSGRLYRRILPWSVAASVIILISFYLLLPGDKPFSIVEERVMPGYLSAEKSSATTPNNTDRLDALFIEAYEAMGTQQYQTADDLLQTIENSSDAEVRLLQAADYNRALILLGQNRTEEGLAQLEQISKDSSHRYHRKARALYKRLAN